MKYILLVMSLLFIGCATKPNYKYDSIDEFLNEYMIHQYMETQEVQMMEIEDEVIVD